MLRLVGIGHALPAIEVSTEFLAGQISEANPYPWIEFRRTTLPLEYIEATGNAEPAQAIVVASESPTSLAVSAVRLALERAQLDPDEIGLILAGGATPRQTTPSEAQRIGKLLGLKVPAYDVCSVGADLALQISSLKKWKKSRIPRYVLCVSTSTATQRVNYRNGSEAFLIGDGACACILSTAGKEGFEIVSAQHRTDMVADYHSSIEIYGHLRIVQPAFKDWYSATLEKELTDFFGYEKGSPTSVCCEQLVAEQTDLIRSCTAEQVQICCETGKFGYLLGPGGFLALSMKWDHGIECSSVVVLSGGVGQSFGTVSLKQ